MRYIVLATDYDETLASHGVVHDDALQALENLRASGRKLILATGRHLKDLESVFPRMDLFDYAVVENGAVLYRPSSRKEKLLCEPPPQAFVSHLERLGVPFETGQVIVATRTPHHISVLDAIRELELDLQVIFNKGAVMVLPSGVNKATGMHAALAALHLSFHHTVAIGDAENDHALLSAAQCGVAVANAVPSLKQHADVLLKNGSGAGVIELAEQLLRDDLALYDGHLQRRWIKLGKLFGRGSD